MRILAFVPDLLDRSKLETAATAAGARVDIVPAPVGLVGRTADLFVVDLSRPGALEVLAQLPGRVIGFGPHVDRDLLRAARTAGCRDVLARSVFFARLPQLLAEK